MGIRFYCPNGHKLNVKEFQAGRRGICPFCGARTLIPTQSTRPASKSRGGRDVQPAATQTAVQEDDAQGSDSSPDILPGEPPGLPGDPSGGRMLGPSTAPDIPSGGQVVAPPTAPGTPARPKTMPAQPAVSMPAARAPTAPSPAAPIQQAAPVAPAATQPSAESPDPIAEAPEMIWYIRPPSGGQFVPAPGELMRTWMAEGRISADSLIWREGWRDWLEAGTVFPKLRGTQFIDMLESAPIPSVVSTPVSHAHAHRPKSHHASDRSQLTLLIGLSVAVVVLIIVFLYVLFFYR